jgi:hypothetical protein
MFQTKAVEEIKTQILSPIKVLKIRALYDIMWKNFVYWGRPQMTIWLMRFACWIPKATNTQRERVILIAFPLERWLKTWRLKVTLHAHCLSCFYFSSLIFRFDILAKHRKTSFRATEKNLFLIT